jgi:hypothetical protein
MDLPLGTFREQVAEGADTAPQSSPEITDGLARVAAYVSASDRIAALTGAGLSTESGIPDYGGRTECGRRTRRRSVWSTSTGTWPIPRSGERPGRSAFTILLGERPPDPVTAPW